MIFDVSVELFYDALDESGAPWSCLDEVQPSPGKSDGFSEAALELGERPTRDVAAMPSDFPSIRVLDQVIHGPLVTEQICDLADAHDVGSFIGREEANQFAEDTVVSQPVFPYRAGWRVEELCGRRRRIPSSNLVGVSCDAVFPRAFVEDRRKRKKVETDGL